MISSNTVFSGFYLVGDKVCRDGYEDTSTIPPCVTRIDPCASQFCGNGTHYETSNGSCACLCPQGYIGGSQEMSYTSFLELIYEYCIEIMKFSCMLLLFPGNNCQSHIDYCLSSPCQNGGTCKSGTSGYNCRCPSFYIGDNCELSKCEVIVKNRHK